MKLIFDILKIIFDRVVAFLAIIILAIPAIILVIIIKIDSKGKAVFKQERIGKRGKTFYVYKFRTMKTTDIPFDVNRPIIDNNDENLTKVGKIIRRYKIDELLQLINVLKGDMSLIGPRPLMSIYLPMYSGWELQKFEVLPGMSGLAQIKGNSYLSLEERSYYDIEYIKKRSIIMDFEIIVKTFLVVALGEERFLTKVSEEEIERVKKEFYQ